MSALPKIAEQEILGDGQAIRVIRAKAYVEPTIQYERNCRSLNHMEPGTRLIHARLEEWAKEVKRFLGTQGFPGESYYHKWALLKIAPHPGHDPAISDRAARVDAAVARLPQPDKAVLERYYLRWRPTRIWEHLAGINSESTFKRVLKRARWRTEGFLLAVESSSAL